MQVGVQLFTVNKRFPLTISRGTTAYTTNGWVTVEHDGIAGWGEASPFSVGTAPQTTDAIAQALYDLAPHLAAFSPFERQPLEHLLTQFQVPSAVRAALDMAWHDWLGKRAGIPLWQLWGGDRRQIGPTSITIGIGTPEAARQRLRHWLELAPFKAIKVKLGNPAGIEADQAMLQAVIADMPLHAKLSVDANGGWTLEQAIAMADWLAEQGVIYIEQPLPQGQEQDLPVLYQRSPLPIFVDESCFKSRDIPLLADRVHGINIKLMKSGGLTEAKRMIDTARACGLQVMFGCYSDSVLSNTAAAHLSSFADHLDLDSHLNLVDDPFVGATLQDACLLPNDLPGLGVTRTTD